MKNVTLTIEGITPLLMNSASAFTVPKGDAPKSRSQRIPSPEEEAESGVYRLDDGLGFIASAFRKVLISAAKGRKIGRMGLPGIVQGSVFETTELVKLVDPANPGTQLTNYAIDIRGARPPGQGMVRRARPRLDAWQCDVMFEYDEELVGPELIHELMDSGGMRVGIGNFRPEKSGRYGRFKVIAVDGKPV